jgi:hypothetical protein
VAIYGSWASSYEGIAGRAPHDVDVLVIGEVPRRYLYEAAERAEQRLGLPVNPRSVFAVAMVRGIGSAH